MDLSHLSKENAEMARRVIGPDLDAIDKLSGHKRKMAAKKLKKKLERRLKKAKAKSAAMKIDLSILDDLLKWSASEFILCKCDSSKYYKLVEAYRNGNIEVPADGPDPFDDGCHSFLVSHDWAKAFSSAQLEDEEFKLPYDACSFEFNISGKHVVSIFTEYAWTVFVSVHAAWWCLGELSEIDDDGLKKYISDQVRAVCIVLDADIAAHEVIRAPSGLNEKRVRKGKDPIPDYHIVDLSRRTRIMNQSNGESGRRVRLHFRRGHWRHYEDTKTWIRWCLVGDPDLGFVDKHYKL